MALFLDHSRRLPLLWCLCPLPLTNVAGASNWRLATRVSVLPRGLCVLTKVGFAASRTGVQVDSIGRLLLARGDRDLRERLLRRAEIIGQLASSWRSTMAAHNTDEVLRNLGNACKPGPPLIQAVPIVA